MLRELGGELEFFPGVPEILGRLADVVQDESFAKHEVALEHYIVSTGLRQMILGSSIAPHVDGVWGCEFVEEVPLPGFRASTNGDPLSEQILDIGYAIDNTTKTRAILRSTKGRTRS
jgi:hypothetical protein